MMKMIPAALLLLASIPHAVSLQCYHVSGDIVKDTKVVPCNPSVTGKAGSHTSCCNKGTGDQCTSTGLCLATISKRPDDLFWINGCTDPTWRDPACPQYCNPPVNPTTSTEHPRLKICGNGTRYCCSNYYANDTECCENSFTLNRSVGVVIAHLTEGVSTVPDGSDSTTTTISSALGGPSSTSSPPPNDNEAAAGSISLSGRTSDKNSTAAAVTGGVLGTALLAVCAAAFLLLLQNRRLKTDLEAKRAELEERNKQQQRLLGGDGANYKVYDAHDRSAEMYGQSMHGMVVDRMPAYTYTSEMPTSEGRIGQLP